MSVIRKRNETGQVVPGGKMPVEAGGFVDASENPLLSPGTADVSALAKAQISNADSAAGALKETIAAKALRGWDYSNIPSEEGFDPTKALGDKVSGFDSDELEFLGDARSSIEMQQRLGQVTQTRENYADMAAHPLTAMATSLLDVDLVVGLGVGKLATVGRAGRLAAALSANSAVLGYADQGGHLSALDIIGSSLGAALGALPKAAKAVRALDEAEIAAGRAAKVADEVPPAVPAAGVADTVEVPVRVPEKLTAAELAQTDTTIKVEGKVPDADYTPPTPDLSTGRPYMEVIRGNGRATLQTDTQNFVRGVLDMAKDLPAGVRALGEALMESLSKDGRVPLVVRTEQKSSRSNNQLFKDGSMKTTLYVEGGSKQTLTQTIGEMSTYEHTIALHEAAHAKTQSTIMAFEKGVLPPGPAFDAVTRLDQLRVQIRGVAKNANFKGIVAEDWRNQVMYGLNDPHEFISQLFNSHHFREVLQGVKIEGQSVWSDLVSRVVQAFTGKAPGSTGLEHAIAAFEDLIKIPHDPNIGARAIKAVPDMQTDLIKSAPTPAAMLTAVGSKMNKNFALYDAIKSLGTKAAVLADQLVVDATGTSANSATHGARTAHLAANVAAAQVDAAINQALSGRGWNAFTRLRHPQQYREADRAFSNEVYSQLAENHARFLEGGTIGKNADAAVQNVVENFAKSRWAEDQLAKVKTTGMRGAEDITPSPYYLPRRHSGTKVSSFLRDNPNITREDVAGMYGSQFARMFADQGIEPRTAKALGNQMLRNMDERAAGVSGYRQHIAGMTGDDIEFAMRNAGIDEDQIAQFLRVSETAGSDANTVRNLRSRADFDMTADYTTKSGDLINPQMFVDKDVRGLMEGYSRSMSGRIGLAQAGFPDVKSLAKAVDDAAAEAADPRAAREMMDSTVNQILGYQTGENVPDILRSMAVVSGAVNLANSGIYQLADASLMIKEFGVTKTMKALASSSWGRNGLELAQSAEYGSRLRDILEARNVLSGRWRTVMTHLDDNTDIGNMGIAHQMIQQMGQGTRFVNGMEFLRRGQSRLTAGLIADTIDSALKGDAAAIKQMARFGLTDDLVRDGGAALRASEDLRMWPDNIRLQMENVGQNMADALVQENRLGEIPAWMQFSTLGKFILPYMNFVAGTWNKVLRRTYKQDGAQGIAMMFAYQLPLTTLASVAAMAGKSDGKAITPTSVAENVLTQLPLMSWLGYGINILTQGPTNSIAALSVVDKAYSATKGIVTGNPDAAQIIRAVPFAGLIPGMRIFTNALSEDK